mmetsp:Transcript_39406/g.93279  ORF Transcript_39406/g.93279 Transcript_39406/m.93279 type:complete len:225 (+) Transcript_39406:1488-2162(+)
MGRFEISSMKRSYLSVSRSQRTTSRIVSLLERRIAESTATFLSCSDLHFMSASRVPSSACLIALVRREAPPSGSLPVPDLMPSAEICDIAFASCPEASSPCSSTSSAAAGGMRESFSKRAHIMLSLRFPSATSKHRTWLRSGPTSTSPSPPPPPPPPPPLKASHAEEGWASFPGAGGGGRPGGGPADVGEAAKRDWPPNAVENRSSCEATRFFVPSVFGAAAFA